MRNNVIIGAISIVTKDILDGVVVVGALCKLIGFFENFANKMKD